MPETKYRSKVFLFLLPALILTLTSLDSRDAPADDVINLDAIVVTARGYAADDIDIPGGIAVATEREINDAALRGSVADVLDAFPGISRTGESPYAQDISIRGLSGSSIVILVNGKRVFTATDINARMGFVNPADIERVEVLKGPLSALYGSGSVGGVVNIITRKPSGFSEKPEVFGRISLSGGTNPQGVLAYGHLGFNSPKANLSASFAHRDFKSTRGFDRNPVPNSQYRDVYGKASLGLKPSDNLTLTTEFIKSVPDGVGIPGGNTAMPDIARIIYPGGGFTMISEDLDLVLDGKNLKRLQAEFHHTTNKRRVRIDNVGAVPAPQPQPILLEPKADHETFGGKLSSTWEFGSNLLVAGADFWTWKVTSSRRRVVNLGGTDYVSVDHPTPRSDQFSAGVFVSDTYEAGPKLSFYFGGRVDALRTKNEDLYFVNPVNLSEKLLFAAQTNDDLGWQVHL
ncbi:MAG: TonB-dependent receptor plug domain-containing protein, partial [Deltaproteobacteria bacterium]|nr:TonB-dependent receptor plug domain-containing protein [Deltaproteobacteria bacterium]